MADTMDPQRELEALAEIREIQTLAAKRWRVVFILCLLATTLPLIFFTTSIPRSLLQVLSVIGAASIFGIVFQRRVGIMVAKRKFKDTRPHRRLLQYSDPDDIELSVEDALKKVLERQEKDLEKYRRR